MFYGIIIKIYLMDNVQHNIPHIHAVYAEYSASVAISDGEILAGKLPGKQKKLIDAWIEIHKEELMADWSLAVAGELPFKIDPLK